MTFMEFVGCASVAYGPTLALLVFTIVRDPVRTIVFVASAFFWLVSFLLSSLVWYILPLGDILIVGVIVTVMLQECFRYLFYLVLKKAEKGLKQVSQLNLSGQNENSRKMLSYVAGLGFGVMSGTFPFINILAAISGPGTIGLHGGYTYFALVSALLTLCFTLLNTFWSVIFYSAVDTKNYFLLGWVVFSHLLASCITLLNEKSMYYISLGFTYFILTVSGHLAYKVYESRLCSCFGSLVRQREFIPSTSQVVS